MTFLQLLKVSRPHFWLYEFGTFIIGCLIGYLATGSLDSWHFILIFGLYFLIPGNLLIYGINDVFDYETDLRNPRKTGLEGVLPKPHHRIVLTWVIFSTLPFAIVALSLPTSVFIWFVAFIFFAVGYSLPPVRAKARPGLDSFFSGSHYVATGVFGFVLVAPDSPLAWLLIIAALLWTFAMHAYSAVPDISADTEAGVPTIATAFGGHAVLTTCLFLYSSSFFILSLYTQPWFILMALPYVYLVYKSYHKTEAQQVELYRYFPYLNALVGAVLTIYLILLIQAL